MVVHGGRPEVDEVRVVRHAGEAEITATALSTIPLREIVDGVKITIAEVMVLELDDSGTPGEDGHFDEDTNDAAWLAGKSVEALRRRRTVTDELLQEVARVYEGDTTGAPTKAVADHFPTSHRNATRYVALARERGFLAPYREEPDE